MNLILTSDYHGERVIDLFGIGVCVKIPLKRCE